MCPSCDLTVIKHLVSVLNMRATPSRNKAARIKHPLEIWAAALKAMDEAETSDELTPLHRSCAYRDALALGILALRPIRLKNLAQLTLSEHLTYDGSRWQCSFSGCETKDKKPLHFALPTDVEFVTRFERYLTVHRPVLLRDLHNTAQSRPVSQLTGPLWISTRRSRMSLQSLYWNTCRISERLFNVRLNPHLMRDCATSAMSSDAPEYILAAARILGHSTLTTTIGHYEQSSMLAAGAHLNDFIGQLQAENNSEDNKEDLFDLPFEQPFEEDEEEK
jgi:integrase